ncbi:MAG TPA: ECF-type sigma factor, partial [Pirellulaceae bacterium]
LSSLASREANPDQAAEFNDELGKLLSSLAQADRLLLQMRLDGQSADEITKALGIHPIAMRVRWTRLRKRLETSGIMADWL